MCIREDQCTEQAFERRVAMMRVCFLHIKSQKSPLAHNEVGRLLENTPFRFIRRRFDVIKNLFTTELAPAGSRHSTNRQSVNSGSCPNDPQPLFLPLYRAI